jgi:thiamine biosynthesis lipoprotein
MSTRGAERSFRALGTTAVVLADDETAVERAAAVVAAELDVVDHACSRFRAGSELRRLDDAGGRAVPVSPVFAAALAVALRAAELTDGIVDPTVGGVLVQLGYDRDFATLTPDGPPLVVRTRKVPGWTTIELDLERATVRVPSGVQLDLGATAKAWAADRAAGAAAAAVGGGVLVGLGGDVAVAGPAPSGGWPVRVTDDHAAGSEAEGETVAVHAGGLATSGTTVRRWTRGGVVLHHLIDPRTGRPAGSCWRTVSVAAATCVDANIASTAAMILGAEAPGWLETRRLDARLVRPDDTVVTVAGWPSDDEAAA